jgi:hypothetical protein
MPSKDKAGSIELMILDPATPDDQRLAMMAHLLMDGSDPAKAVALSILQAAAAGKGKELYEKKLKDLERQINELKEGALRLATYIDRSIAERVHVRLDDGTAVFPLVLDQKLAAVLRRGDEVLVDAGGKLVVHCTPHPPKMGEEAVFLRCVDDDNVEVTLRDHEKHVFMASADLVEKLHAGEVQPNSSLLVCPRRQMAFAIVPQPKGTSHYMYLDRGPIPDVIASRDLGAPPPYIAQLAYHLRAELLHADARRRYRLRRTVMKLLAGVSGSGKTFSIEAFIRLAYEIMSEVTGVPMESLPPRVLRMTTENVLSMWLGESDKQLSRLFDEAVQLYDELFTTPDGKEYHLPVIVIGEEIEALSRARGTDYDSVYDRIQSVALRRLDSTRPEFKTRLIVFLFTSNVPHLIDPAFMRRAGGTIEQFGRLTRPRSFCSVLEKHLHGLPFAGDNGAGQETIQRRVVNDISAWMFSRNGEDQGQVELQFAGSTESHRKYRRDFLTCALIDRAVQEAAAEACRQEELGCEHPGLTFELLVEAFDRQIRSIVTQLNENNVGNYVDLPDGVRATRVIRLERASVLPFPLMRNTRNR